jgi:hypothetical protein
MPMTDPGSPDSPGSPPPGKALTATGVHPHIASAWCLAGLVRPHVISALTAGPPGRRGQPLLVGLVTACHRRTLPQIPGTGVTGIAAIRRQLPAAGPVGDTGQDAR